MAAGRWQRAIRFWRELAPGVRFACRGILIAAVFYAALYYPWDPGSVPGRLLAWYITLQARLSGACLRLVDSSVMVTGTIIAGRFPLNIVVDCTALDAMALYAAAILAFPAPPRTKALALAGGLMIVATANLGRIVFLYFAGVHWPAWFDFLHEEVLQIGVILVPIVCFVAFVARVRLSPPPTNA